MKPDSTTQHILFQTGVMMSRIKSLVIMPPLDVDYKPYNHNPHWDKLRDELICKYRNRKARINKFIVTLLMIGSVILIFTVTLLVLFLICPFIGNNQIVPIALGMSDVMLCIISYYFWTERIPCNPNYIQLKRKH